MFDRNNLLPVLLNTCANVVFSFSDMSLRKHRLKLNVNDYLYADPSDSFIIKKVSEEVGNGLFAQKSFFKGDFVLFYRGQRLTAEEYEAVIDKSYLFSNDTDLFIDASDTNSGLARYMNDSLKDPNCVASIYRCKEKLPHVMFKTLRNIEAGEELRYSYGPKNGIHRPWLENKSVLQGNFSKKSELTVESVLENHQSEVLIEDNFEEQAIGNTPETLARESSSAFTPNENKSQSESCLSVDLLKETGGVETEETEIENAASKDEGNMAIGCKTTISVCREIGQTVREISLLYQSAICDNLSDSNLQNVQHSAELQAEEIQRKNETNRKIEKFSDVYTPENSDSESSSDENDDYAEERQIDEASEKISNCKDPETVVQHQTEQNETSQASINENLNGGVCENAVSQHSDVNESTQSPFHQHQEESGNISLQSALEHEESVDDCYAYAPLECFLCGKKLFGDHQIARHVFLQECTNREFEVLDPQSFQFFLCRCCPTVFFGFELDEISEHVSSAHGKAVFLNGVSEKSGTIEQYMIDPFLIDKICRDYRTGKLKRKTTAEHSTGNPSWFRKKPHAANFNARKNADPDYSPSESTVRKQTKKAKKVCLTKEFDRLSKQVFDCTIPTQPPGNSEVSGLPKKSAVQPPNNVNDENSKGGPNTSEEEVANSIEISDMQSADRNEVELSKNCKRKRKSGREKLVCTLCYKVLNNKYVISEHLEHIHKIRDRKQRKMMSKILYFQSNYNCSKKKRLYVCFKPGCLLTFHRKDKHTRQLKNNETLNEHFDFIKPIHRLNQLPEEFLPEELSVDEPLTVKPNIFGIDLQKTIELWAAEKVDDYQEGVGQRTYAPERMPSLLKKLKMFVIDSKGFMYPPGVESLFNKLQEHYRVNSGKTKLFYCREFLNFIHYSKINDGFDLSAEQGQQWRMLCERMEMAVQRVNNRAQKSASCEMSVNREFKARAKLSKQHVKEIFDKIISLLKEILVFFESPDLSRSDPGSVDHSYKLLQCCLIFVVSNRNVSRVGSAIWLKKTFLKTAYLVKSQGVVTFKCFDVKKMETVIRNTNSKTLRVQKREVTLELMRSNKNYKTEAGKELILTYEEYWFFLRYLVIKEKIGAGDQEYLFLKRDQKNEILNRNIVGKWHCVLESHLKLDVKINTSVWRQSMCTIFSQEVTDMRIQGALDRHIGHSRKIAELFYELNCKVHDAVVTFRAVDDVLASNKVLNAESQNLLDDREYEDTVFQFKGLTFETELVPTTKEIELKTMMEEDEIEPEDEEAEDEPAATETENNSHFSDGVPSEIFIYQFLLSSARKKNLSFDQYRVVAAFFRKSLIGEERGTLKDLHESVQRVELNPHANYNHVCHLIKKLHAWKEQGYK